MVKKKSVGYPLTEEDWQGLRENVARGVALLDEKKPNWWRLGAVNLTRLDMASHDFCMLGQLSGTGSFLVLAESFFPSAVYAHDNNVSAAHGFTARSKRIPSPSDIDPYDALYRALDVLWVAAIRERRKLEYSKVALTKALHSEDPQFES